MIETPSSRASRTSHVMVSIFLDEQIGAQEKNCVHGIIDDDERFCGTFTVERPHNTAGTSVLLSIADAAVETTIVCNQNSVQSSRYLNQGLAK